MGAEEEIDFDKVRLTKTRAPFDLGNKMKASVESLDMGAQVQQLQDEGYSVIENIASHAFNARLRQTCLRLAQETEGKARGYSAALLLGRDPIFEEVVLNPKIQALAEIMCGKGALLSQLICSIRPKGAPALGLHADQNWFPAPFPEHNQLLTLCWAMDPFTESSGATKVIPGTQVHRRHPDEDEIAKCDGAVPITCPKGSIAFWDGSVWHGNFPRQDEGERVVLHITFSRMSLRTVENYDHLDATWLEGRPHALSVMLGREDFLGSTTIARGSADYKLIPRSFNWAKT